MLLDAIEAGGVKPATDAVNAAKTTEMNAIFMVVNDYSTYYYVKVFFELE